MREQLRRQSLDTRNTIWSILQVEGLKPPKLRKPGVSTHWSCRRWRTRQLAPLLRPLVAVAEHLDRQVAGLDKMIASACQGQRGLPDA